MHTLSLTSTAAGLSVILVFSVFSYLLAAGVWVRASFEFLCVSPLDDSLFFFFPLISTLFSSLLSHTVSFIHSFIQSK